MAPPSYNAQTAQERWQQFSAAAVRAFHRYATWLVSLGWWRFGWYALLLIIAAGLLQKLPPFSMTYYETVVESARHRKPKSPPTPPAPVQKPQQPEHPAQAEAASEVSDGHASKSVGINLPGISIDTGDHPPGTKGVNISFSASGIHIFSDEPRAPVAAASAASQAPSGSQAGPGTGPHGAAAAAAPAAAASAAVDMVVDGQHAHIDVPSHANSEEVRAAIEEARKAILESLAQADKERQAAAQEAAEAAVAAAKATHDDDGDGDDDDSDWDSGSQRKSLHERTITIVPLSTMAVWWILGSILIKVTYKGRMQAEVKAAVATETAEAESLRRQVLEARMAMMQAQVEPHFLFNTLASIDHLIEFDPKRASQMQRNLISLLRASMPSMRTATDSGRRPLELELAVVRPYLEILKVRMEERLTTEIDVPDGLLSAEFPPMMVQTLVENAIKHGLEPKAEGGHLSVKAEIRHGKLCVIVSDTGLGFAGAAGRTSGTGVGLANIRERLALLYGSKGALTIANNPAGGTIVTITVPYTAHADAATDEGAQT